MTTYVSPFYQAYAVDFQKYVNVVENVHITKTVDAAAWVAGNIGIANADAKAFGYDSLAETLTLTYSTQGQGSGAFSESVSATNGAYAWYAA